MLCGYSCNSHLKVKQFHHEFVSFFDFDLKETSVIKESKHENEDEVVLNEDKDWKFLLLWLWMNDKKKTIDNFHWNWKKNIGKMCGKGNK